MTTGLLISAGSRARVLILTTFDLDEYDYDAMRGGASGFLLKDVGHELFLAGVRTVAAGEALVAPSVTRRLVEQFALRPRPGTVLPAGLQRLTTREVEVLRLMARGLSNTEVAAELVVSTQTVESHVAHLLDKLRLRDRVQAVVMANECGVVQPGANGSRPEGV